MIAVSTCQYKSSGYRDRVTYRANHHNGPRADIVLIDDYVNMYEYTESSQRELLRDWYGAVTGNHIDVVDVMYAQCRVQPTRATRMARLSLATVLPSWLLALSWLSKRDHHAVWSLTRPDTIETAPELECWAHRDAGR